MDFVRAHESKDGHHPIELAQLYDPSEMPQNHNQVHIYQDQYGRRIFVDERGNIVRVEEPSSYPQGETPPPLGAMNQGPMDSGSPYDRDVPEAPNAPAYQSNGTPNDNAPAIRVPQAKETVAAVPIMMDRIGSSPGAIDGLVGSKMISINIMLHQFLRIMLKKRKCLLWPIPLCEKCWQKDFTLMKHFYSN